MNTASSPSRSFTLNWVFCLASRVLSGSESHVSAVTTAPLFDCLPFPVPLRNHQLSNSYLGIYVWKNPNQNFWHLWHLWLSPRCYAPKWITQSFFRVKIHPALPTRSSSQIETTDMLTAQELSEGLQNVWDPKQKALSPKYQEKSAKPSIVYVWLNVYKM